jgi:hypothetical protein
LGTKAVEMIKEREFGLMASFQACAIVPISLKEVVGGRKNVPLELYEMAKTFFK